MPITVQQRPVRGTRIQNMRRTTNNQTIHKKKGTIVKIPFPTPRPAQPAQSRAITRDVTRQDEARQDKPTASQHIG
jgi:hypothetical protein